MLFKDTVLLSDNAFPGRCEEPKQILKMLDVEYKSYHACQMIVLYIEANMQTKRYAQNVGMTSTINQEIRMKHMLFIIIY